MALNSDRQYYEQELEKAEAKWRELDGRKLYAWVLIFTGGAIALAYLLHRDSVAPRPNLEAARA